MNQPGPPFFYHIGINPSLMKRVHLLINAFVEVLLGQQCWGFACLFLAAINIESGKPPGRKDLYLIGALSPKGHNHWICEMQHLYNMPLP